MKQKINLTESDLKRIVTETVKRHLKEYNGSDAIEDYENGIGSLENGYEGNIPDDDPAGFDDNSIPGVEREGGIEDVCRGKFDTVDDLKGFLLKLGEVTASEDMMEEYVRKIDEIVREEGNTYN